jgi:hypothetical protein
MKKNISKASLKNIGYILGYWVIFVIIPFGIGVSMYNYLINNSIKYLDRVPFYIIVYLLFIAPFLYFVPYRLAKPKGIAPFIIFGAVIPYLFIYLFIYLFLHVAFRGFGGGIG